LVGRLLDLCRIPSPSGDVNRIREHIRSVLLDLGYPSEIDEYGNLFTFTESTEHEAIFLSCHMDTVPTPDVENLTVVSKDGRISSDGTSILGGDDKLGVAAAIEMLDLCRQNPGRHRGLDIVFTVDEEIGARGAAALNPQRFRASQGFNLDGETGPGTAINRAPRKERFHCRVHGRSSHAALAPEEGISAIVIAAKIITQLPLGMPGPQSTSNVGMITGGGQTNIIPDFAEMTGELRSFSDDEFENIRLDINRVCRSAAIGAGGKADIRWEFLYDGYHVDTEETCSALFADACWKAGREPLYMSSRGGGDSNALNSQRSEEPGIRPRYARNSQSR
jgi:tripeptide aminopeptidase